MRIKLKYVDEQSFIEKFGAYVTRNGIFLATRTVKPPGTVVRFELLLADGRKLMKGEGVVQWKREYDAQNPMRPPGMGLKYSKLDADSRKLIDRIIKHKKETGVGEETGVPAAPLAIPESGPVAVSQPAIPIPPEVAMARGSSPGEVSPALTRTESPPELAAMVPDEMDVGALLDDDGPKLAKLMERAREIARAAARGGEAADGLAELEKLLDTPSEPALASIEVASQALAALLGAAAPAMPRKPGVRTVDPSATSGAPATARAPATPPPVTPAAPPVTQAAPLPPPELERKPRRSVPPPPPPGRRTQPPPMIAAPAPPPEPVKPSEPIEIELGEDDTREVSLAAIAQVDAALASIGDEDDPAADFGGADATRLTPPRLLADDATADDEQPTGVGFAEDAPTSAAIMLEPPTKVAAAAASLGADEIDVDALSQIVPQPRRARRVGGEDVEPLPPPPGEPDDGLDEGSMLEIDPDEEDLPTGIVKTPAPEGMGASPMVASPAGAPSETDLAAALDAALDLRIEGDDDAPSLDDLPRPAAALPADDMATADEQSSPSAELPHPGDDDAQSGKKKSGFFSKLFKK